MFLGKIALSEFLYLEELIMQSLSNYLRLRIFGSLELRKNLLSSSGEKGYL